MKITLSTGMLCIAALLFSYSFKMDDDIKVGDKIAPFFTKADNNKPWNSHDVLGKKNLVVYFYPAAMTGGCTKQACSYRDHMPQLDSLNAVIVGISGDNVKNLQLFKEAHQLNFTLLSDSTGKIAKAFGVPVKEESKSIEREINGTTYELTRNVTSSRWTFVVNKEGYVVYKSTQVNASEDSKNVIEVLQNL